MNSRGEREDGPALPIGPFQTYGDLVDGAERGDPVAVYWYNQCLFELREMLKRQVKFKLQHRNDRFAAASDVVQSALASYFTSHAYAIDPRDPQCVWSTMLKITLRHGDKWKKRIDRHPTQPIIDELTGEIASSIPSTSSPASDELASVGETLVRVLAEFDELDHAILTLILAGWDVARVATHLKVAEALVERVRRKLLRRLKELFDAEHK